MELHDKVMIITGASSGIGAATARLLNEAGMKFVLTARSEQKLVDLAAQLRQAVIVPGDITDPTLPQRLVDEALTRFGRLDVVFNNAGVMHVGTLEEVNIEELASMIRINFEAVVRLSYTALGHLKQQGSGYIITTSSIAGRKTAPTLGVYNGTKHAVEAFTDALRMELAGSGVGVATVQPGTVTTGLYDSWRARGKQGFDEIGHPLTAEDVARCVQFILQQPPHMLVASLFAVPADAAY